MTHQVKHAASLFAEQLPHSLEQRVHRELLRDGRDSLSQIVVRRLPNGVCLEGVVRSIPAALDAERTARRIPGVREVLNHLVLCCHEAEEAAAEVG